MLGIVILLWLLAMGQLALGWVLSDRIRTIEEKLRIQNEINRSVLKVLDLDE